MSCDSVTPFQALTPTSAAGSMQQQVQQVQHQQYSQPDSMYNRGQGAPGAPSLPSQRPENETQILASLSHLGQYFNQTLSGSTLTALARSQLNFNANNQQTVKSIEDLSYRFHIQVLVQYSKRY